MGQKQNRWEEICPEELWAVAAVPCFLAGSANTLPSWGRSKRNMVSVGTAMTHSIIRPYAIIISSPSISATVPPPLSPHRGEARRRRGDCGTSAASFSGSSGTDSTSNHHLFHFPKESVYFCSCFYAFDVPYFEGFVPNKQSGITVRGTIMWSCFFV